MSTSRSTPFHHGNLRLALLKALAESVLETGPAAVSLRELARRAGVSHAAPAYHFGDKRGLLTAFATEGHRLLAAALQEADRRMTGDFTEIGIAYIRFALEHRAHFEVMFRPELLRRDDPDLRAAAAVSASLLKAGPRPGSPDHDAEMVGAWSLVHGFATLWLNGNIPEELGPPEALARRVAAVI